MHVENNQNEPTQQPMAKEGGKNTAIAQNPLARDTDAYRQTVKAVSDVYDKTAHAVSDVYDKTAHAVSDVYDKSAHAIDKTYAQAKSYQGENPGKTMLIALGLGIGLGFLLGARFRHASRTGRFAKPVVNALSDIALEYFH